MGEMVDRGVRLHGGGGDLDDLDGLLTDDVRADDAMGRPLDDHLDGALGTAVDNRAVDVVVILKSIRYALLGKRAGWGKFERKGTVRQPVDTKTIGDVTVTPLSTKAQDVVKNVDLN